MIFPPVLQRSSPDFLAQHFGREIRRISVLEADLEKSKGDKENAVAEERMKARRARARAQFFGIWIWMDPVLPKGKSPCLTGAIKLL